MIKIRFIKEYRTNKIGDIVYYGKKAADIFISQGIAENYDLIEATNKINENSLIKEEENKVKCQFCQFFNQDFCQKKALVVKKNQHCLEFVAKENKKPQLDRLRIDDYYDNIVKFYKIQPFFYDKNNLFWFWNNNLKKWDIVDDIDLMNELDEKLSFGGQTVNSKVKQQYMESFKRVGRKNKPQDAPKRWIQFKDKAYSLRSGNIYDVEPNYFFCNPIPWELSDSEDTPYIDKLFTDWVGDKKQVLYEIIAYCCYSSYPIQSIICLHGNGRNGKSQFIRLIERFFGMNNICGAELDRLCNPGIRFESFKLYKKLVCIMGETDWGSLKSSSTLKKLTGGDLIDFEVKNKQPFNDYNYAKLIIATNSLPSSNDSSDGFYRRWVIVKFMNEFEEGEDIIDKIPIQEYNNLARKVINILPNLLKQKKLSFVGSIEERKEAYIMASNPLPQFIKHFCKIEDGLYMKSNDLYGAYIKFLKKIKQRKVGRVEFKSALEDEGLFITKESKKTNYNEFLNTYWVDGINLNSDWDNWDSWDTFITNFYIGKKSINLSQKSQKSQKHEKNENIIKTEKIHHKCLHCGNIESDLFGDDGKPYCWDCVNALKANGINVVKEYTF